MTFAADIEEAANEPIEAVVIGAFGWDGYAESGRHRSATAKAGTVLSWEEARSLLDYEYDSGYGAPDCHAIRAWTANKVLWVTQYDGSTRISETPRHPIAHTPDMPGG